MKKSKSIRGGVYVYTWYSPTIGLGRFAEPTKSALITKGKMTEDSIPIRCYMSTQKKKKK